MDEKRIIRVSGRGRLRLRPDTTRLTVTLGGVFPEYGETLRRSSADTEALREVAAALGFEREALKTLSFNIDTEYEGYNDKNGEYRQRFVGYRFTHVMKLEFPVDNELLGRTLYALAHSPATPELRISYAMRDAEAVKRELLGAAVADASAKAEALCRAAGVRLGDILRIDHSTGEPELEVRPMARGLLAKSAMAESADGAYDMNIEPDDITVDDSVTVTWEIK